MTPESAPYVEMETSLGTFVIELYWQYAPRTCQVRRAGCLGGRGRFDPPPSTPQRGRGQCRSLTAFWRARPCVCRTLRRSLREGTTTASFFTAWCQDSWCRGAVRRCMHAQRAHGAWRRRAGTTRRCICVFVCAVSASRALAGSPSARVLPLAFERPAGPHLADWCACARGSERVCVPVQTPLEPARVGSRSSASTLKMNSTPISRTVAPASSGVPGGEGAHAHSNAHPNARTRTHAHARARTQQGRLADGLGRRGRPELQPGGGSER